MDWTTYYIAGIFDKRDERSRGRDSIFRLSSDSVHMCVNAARKSACATT
jgi:hypothetical protein